MIKIDKRALSRLIAPVAAVAEHRNILVQTTDTGISARAFDGVREIVAVEREVQGSFSFCVSAKLANAAVSFLPDGEVTIGVAGADVVMASGKREVPLPSLPPEEFPAAAMSPEGPARTVPLSLLDGVVWCSEEAPPAEWLRSVMLSWSGGKVTAMAARNLAGIALVMDDGSEPEKPVPAGEAYIPRSVVSLLRAVRDASHRKPETCLVSSDSQRCVVECGNVTIRSPHTGAWAIRDFSIGYGMVERPIILGREALLSAAKAMLPLFGKRREIALSPSFDVCRLDGWCEGERAIKDVLSLVEPSELERVSVNGEHIVQGLTHWTCDEIAISDVGKSYIMVTPWPQNGTVLWLCRYT